MGCCSAHPADLDSAGPRTAQRPVEIETDGALKVLWASASHCYCLLISSAATFVDVRDKDAFNQSHLFGAWSLHSLVTRPTGAPPAPSCLKSLCDLRRVVVVSGEPREDGKVTKLLALLQQTARPSQVLLLDDLSLFQKRFPFCMRQGADTLPLPPCPTELLAPAAAAAKPSQPPALYVGPVACLEPKNEAPLRCFQIGTVIQIVDEPTAKLVAWSGKLQLVHLSKFDAISEGASEPLDLAAKVAAAALEACDRILSQRVPCFLCGPWSMVVAALTLKRILSSELRTTEELCVFLRDRCPTAALPAVAMAALNLALGGNPKAAALAAKLRGRLGEAAESPLRTVRVVLENILAQPSGPSGERLRCLKAKNPRVQREVLANPEVVALLQLAGFVTGSGDLVLPRAAALSPLRKVLQSI